MFESGFDVVVLAGAGALGGFIYWAARNHGEVWVRLWAFISKP